MDVYKYIMVFQLTTNNTVRRNREYRVQKPYLTENRKSLFKTANERDCLRDINRPLPPSRQPVTTRLSALTVKLIEKEQGGSAFDRSF